MKIVFTSSYKTYFKDNTKNYLTNCFSFLNKSDVCFLFIICDGVSTFIPHNITLLQTKIVITS